VTPCRIPQLTQCKSAPTPVAIAITHTHPNLFASRDRGNFFGNAKW
jgi:hypothetical protein